MARCEDAKEHPVKDAGNSAQLAWPPIRLLAHDRRYTHAQVAERSTQRDLGGGCTRGIGTPHHLRRRRCHVAVDRLLRRLGRGDERHCASGGVGGADDGGLAPLLGRTRAASAEARSASALAQRCSASRACALEASSRAARAASSSASSSASSLASSRTGSIKPTRLTSVLRLERWAATCCGAHICGATGASSGTVVAAAPYA